MLAPMINTQAEPRYVKCKRVIKTILNRYANKQGHLHRDHLPVDFRSVQEIQMTQRRIEDFQTEQHNRNRFQGLQTKVREQESMPMGTGNNTSKIVPRQRHAGSQVRQSSKLLTV